MRAWSEHTASYNIIITCQILEAISAMEQKRSDLWDQHQIIIYSWRVYTRTLLLPLVLVPTMTSEQDQFAGCLFWNLSCGCFCQLPRWLCALVHLWLPPLPPHSFLPFPPQTCSSAMRSSAKLPVTRHWESFSKPSKKTTNRYIRSCWHDVIITHLVTSYVSLCDVMMM